MGKWSQKWLQKWGCGPKPSDAYALAKTYTWKQLDHAVEFIKLRDLLASIFDALDRKIGAVQVKVGLDKANGDELDQIGAMVGQPRLGADDDLYRQAIKARARASYAEGAIDDFWDVALLIEPNVIFTVQEVFPACIRLNLGGITPLQQTILFDLLRLVVGLGICVEFVELLDEGELFEWSYLESAPGDPRVLYSVDRHWDFYPDHDIPPSQRAGFAFLSM